MDIVSVKTDLFGANLSIFTIFYFSRNITSNVIISLNEQNVNIGSTDFYEAVFSKSFDYMPVSSGPNHCR